MLINLFLSSFSPGTAISVRGVNVVHISVRGDEDKYEGGRQRSFSNHPQPLSGLTAASSSRPLEWKHDLCQADGGKQAGL